MASPVDLGSQLTVELPAFLSRTYRFDLLSRRPTSLYTDDETKDAVLTPLNKSATRPYVTLTYAQSLDAKIAGPGGKQLALSGKESLVMTHWLRTLHDAIMIGIGTALNDDPQLNTRHLPPLPNAISKYHNPRPIILDANLRLSPSCKLLKNYREGRGRRPWVISTTYSSSMQEYSQRKKELEDAGARVLELASEDGMEHGRFDIPDLLAKLKLFGIRSVMVEGGASVIQSFLAAASGGASGSQVDVVIVTIAPTLVGREGVEYGSNVLAGKVSTLHTIETEAFGPDAVIALRVA
ncbi:hypothetical protein WOLCODRAFT_94924 [Wolfiporia cocos MD-104 SS10]|uniref:2,5-diamino-6-ribosylamino-4(3H)-pyrimidinone 5'-phosphate reductase n=1 Tax=Wolfiporia cocos (strain MD-104) TaxID=742152 RepID=A0A2H3JBV3_WOLCO|nr:hypothetical protein WOLCODRAFT_94924 [Wolfiporia cocos MD-104 SS10]